MRSRNLLPLFLIASTFTAARAQKVVYDTLYTHPVGPGITFTHIAAPSVPWSLNVLEINLKNPYVKMQVVKAQNIIAGLATVSSMASSNDSGGHYVVGGINGDYINATTPINTQVINGEMLRPPIYSYPTIGFDASNHPSMSIVTFSGALITTDSSIGIDGVNQARNANTLVLYNRYWGSTSETDQSGTEVAVHPVAGWAVNDAVLCEVDSIEQGVGNMQIVPGEMVLSGQGTAGSFLSSQLHRGDSVRVVVRLQPDLPNLNELIGAYEEIVRNGQTVCIGATPDNNREPRTGAGFSQDSTKFYMVTVDGRLTSSAGMTLQEFASFMGSIGIYNGANFDGGGSTTMVVGNSLVNSPSGGSERAVSSALMVVSAAPQDSGISSLWLNPFSPRMLRILQGNRWRFTVSGYDKYYDPLSLDPSKISYQVDSSLGTITSGGLFTASDKLDSGYVYASYGNIRDSVFVVVTTLTGVSGGEGTPSEFRLAQNYPNPFNPSTAIKVSLKQAGMMSLKIYNVLGQPVKVVDEGSKPAGEYVYNVNMDNLASGVYFYTLRQGGSAITKKMLLLK